MSLLNKLPMLSIRLWAPARQQWYDGEVVNDPQFLDELIMRAFRAAPWHATYVVHRWHGRWRLATLSPARQHLRFRYYDTQEAAEMVAMHESARHA